MKTKKQESVEKYSSDERLFMISYSFIIVGGYWLWGWKGLIFSGGLGYALLLSDKIKEIRK